MKPGILTSEFWTTVANAAFMFLVAFGLVDQAQADELIALIVALVGAVIPVIVYIIGRNKLKQ